MTKPRPQQFELPKAEEVFNLQVQTAVDGARVQAEQQAEQRNRRDAESRQNLLLSPANHPLGRKIDHVLTRACKEVAIKDALKLKEQAARNALNGDLARFIGTAQRMVLIQHLFKGEEKEWFFDKMLALAQTVRTMPKTYQQDGKGDQAIAYLHYFHSNTDAWITERDQEVEQQQAFGLVKFYGGDPELGYISIEEWLATGAELDFHFTPKILEEIRKKHE